MDTRNPGKFTGVSCNFDDAGTILYRVRFHELLN